ncbi:MAG: phosphatidylglycerol lysyltransferase domain-containing protein, partial [Methanocorpusculum sp.]|nr:phosphatidylglycerol lysyltransferase domain-containing protein [Methanocorpusculum sp.]
MLKESDFQPFTFENIHIPEGYLQTYPKDHSEYSLVTILSWEHYSPCRFAVYKDHLIIECFYEGGRSVYAPVGKPDKAVFYDTAAFARSSGAMFNIYDEADLQMFQELFPETAVEEVRGYFEYCWKSKTLAELAGKRFVEIRGQINQFKRQFSYTTEPVSAENLEEVRALIHLWYAKKTPAKGSAVSDELLASDISLDHYSVLHLEGILLRVDGVPAAVSIWEKRDSDVCLVHYEKGLTEYPGIYKVINQETAKL